MMEQKEFSNLLLKTAFACMACDGDIDESEVKLVKSMEETDKIFGVESIEEELNALIQAINNQGFGFLKSFLNQLETVDLVVSQEIQLVRTAVKTIKADDEEKYSEIKFFKILRSKLKVSDNELIAQLPEFENLEEDYLQQDIISSSYLKKLTEDYFETSELPMFESINLSHLQ